MTAAVAIDENHPPHPPPDCCGAGVEAAAASDSAGESSAVVVPGVNAWWLDLVLSALFRSLPLLGFSSLARSDVPKGGVAVDVRFGD